MSTLKVDTIKSDTTPTLTVSDGLTVSGVTTMTNTLNVDSGSNGMIDFGDITSGYGRLYADSTGTFIGSKSNDPLILRTNHTEVARLDEYGRMMIGQTAAVIGSSSEFAEIVLSGKTRGAGITLKDVDANTQFQIRTDDAGGDPMTLMNASTNHPITIRTNNTERLRIDSSGRLLVGATSDVAPDSFGSLLQIDSSGAGGSIALGRHTNSGSSPALLFHKSRSGGAAGNTIVQSGDSLGSIRWYGADGTDRNSYGAQISANVDGTPGSNDMPGRLTFHTTADGASSATERLRITSAGLVRVPDTGKFVCGDADDLQIHHTSSVNHIRSANGNVVIGTDANNMVILGAYYNAGGGGDTVEVWGGANFLPATNDAIDLGETNHKWDDIYATNGTIQTSDQNNKDNIATSDLGLSFIDKLSPKSYKFKGKTRTHYGLIAQDVETVLSDISKATSDFAGFIKTDAPVQLYNERDEAQNRIPSGKAIGDVKLAAHTDYGLRYGEFIGPLIKAVQELSAKVTALESA